jgi:hypothetical protein
LDTASPGPDDRLGMAIIDQQMFFLSETGAVIRPIE